MNRTIFVAVLMLVSLTAHAERDLPEGRWWRREPVAERLELTNDQQQRLDAIFNGAANELIDAQGEVKKLQVALRAELDRSTVRREDVQRIAAQLNAARGRLFEREVMMLVDMRGVLNPEQWMRLRDDRTLRTARTPRPPRTPRAPRPPRPPR